MNSTLLPEKAVLTVFYILLNCHVFFRLKRVIKICYDDTMDTFVFLNSTQNKKLYLLWTVPVDNNAAGLSHCDFFMDET